MSIRTIGISPASLLAALAVWLGGCAATPSVTSGPAPLGYIPGASYHLLMAEIAVQRSAYLTAAREYLNAAEESDDIELAQRAAEYAFDYGLDSYALRAAQRWQTLDDSDSLSHEYLARLYLRRNDVDRALFHTEHALGPVAERSDDDYLSLGDDLGSDGEGDAATTLLNRLLPGDPDSHGLRLAIARAALRSSAWDLALGFAGEIALTGTDNTALKAQLAVTRAYAGRGDEQDAIEYLAGRIEESPGLGLELELIRLLGAAGQRREALIRLSDLAQRYGAQPEFLRLRALISFSDGSRDAAEQDFNNLLAAGVYVYESFYYLGQIADQNERHRAAINFFSRIRSGPFFVPAQISIGQAYIALDDAQSALDHLNEFSQEYPRHSFDVFEARTVLLQLLGRQSEALAEYDTALTFKPDTVRYLLSRGTLLEELGRIDDALRDMRRAAELAPRSALTRNALGYTLTNRMGRHGEAYAHIRVAMELEPDSAPIIDSMGWVLYQRGDVDSARTFLQRAYDIFPDAEIAAHLGEAMWAGGERDAARQIWAAAAEAEPDNRPLVETMERFLK